MSTQCWDWFAGLILTDPSLCLPIALGVYLSIHGADSDGFLLLSVLNAGRARQLLAVLRQHRLVLDFGVALGAKNQSRLY